MKSIYDMTLNDLESYFLSINNKKYRALQVYEWIYLKKAINYESMTNLNKELIDTLNSNLDIKQLKLVAKQSDEDVNKYLFELADGNKIETVLMKHNYGNSVCVSTQIGCNMNCSFCESGKNKKLRDLTVSEMVLQVLMVEQDITDRVSSVVLMGIGEPFDNYDNIIKFIRVINEDKGLKIGIRHITISTCGIIPKIKQLMTEDMQVNLAISLHAPTNELRNKIMPINKVYNLDLLMETINEYIRVTNRRVTFEYIMLDDINDSENNALELAKLLHGMNCYVNLIPYNKTSNESLKATKKDKIMKFYDILKKKNINVTVRREFGSNIDGACGQLRSQH